MIPENLVRKFKDKLSDIVKLKLPNGCEWEVHFEQSKDKAWFDDGLDSFIQDNSIGIHFFLLFKYAENSHFNVHVFDLTTTEIDYPSKTSSSGKTPDTMSGN
ncbi:unnamed protein product [Cuscuta europaea]|uniref:TF-B3 domain-containing protein n=1 Tax=Cuscuta europaea TaxID=41803 RepID=A0A9P0ZJ57_CUSEU|nr:unnamed protein product [Cuscuta europaea]